MRDLDERNLEAGLDRFGRRKGGGAQGQSPMKIVRGGSLADHVDLFKTAAAPDAASCTVEGAKCLLSLVLLERLVACWRAKSRKLSISLRLVCSEGGVRVLELRRPCYSTVLFTDRFYVLSPYSVLLVELTRRDSPLDPL